MSTNQEIRERYCKASLEIMEDSLQNSFSIFEIMFQLIYGNFEKCQKSSLFPEYF